MLHSQAGGYRDPLNHSPERKELGVDYAAVRLELGAGRVGSSECSDVGPVTHVPRDSYEKPALSVRSDARCDS